MHSANIENEVTIGNDVGDILVSLATLVTEGRLPGSLDSKGYHEGPHSLFNKLKKEHKCSSEDALCSTYSNTRRDVLDLWIKNIPVFIEVFLICSCNGEENPAQLFRESLLLEKWSLCVNHRRNADPLSFNFVQLSNAIRSQLHFSQLTAWLSLQHQESTNCQRITNSNIQYRFTLPGETFEFTSNSLSVRHDFPLTDLANGYTVSVSFSSLPRMAELPVFNNCEHCTSGQGTEFPEKEAKNNKLFDDRMHTSCTLKGKHKCYDFEDTDNCRGFLSWQRNTTQPSTSNNIPSPPPPPSSPPKYNCYNDLKIEQDKSKLLLDAIERSGLKSLNGDNKRIMPTNHNYYKIFRLDDFKANKHSRERESSDNSVCDMSESDISRIRNKNQNCDSSNLRFPTTNALFGRRNARKRLTFGSDNVSITDIVKDHQQEHSCVDIPSAQEQAKFRRDLDNAASMVFHSRTGLPLTSSPAPIRRGRTCFDFDSSINSVSAIKSALFPTTFSTDDDSESDGSIVSPCSPELTNTLQLENCIKYRRKGHAANLLGSFEESVLNGRLEPVSTVHGFTAELGASGSFVPKHIIVPVTVFFYTLGDNDKVSTPYLGHINLGRKGYNVPRSGTVQVTLFNPLGTVVKMFVIMYDVNDMPNNSQTFIRQRTLYMPTNCRDDNVEWGPKWLRYLIHLRFMSSKSGKVYLHSDIRMIIFRKSDMDTATAHGIDMSYELRSFTHMPTNPRFSPRK